MNPVVAPPSAGLLLAVACVLLPALPLGPIAASPPLPIALLWLAYGWAASGESGWSRPALLFGLGLLQDQLAGGPLGLMAAMALFAYLFGGLAARLTRSFSLLTEWGGFAATAAAAGAATMLTGTLALEVVGVTSFALAALITVAAFPVVRPLYAARGPSGPAAAIGGAR